MNIYLVPGFGNALYTTTYVSLTINTGISPPLDR